MARSIARNALNDWVFLQISAGLDLNGHRAARYDGEHEVRRFACLDQCLDMAFAQRLIGRARQRYPERLRRTETDQRADG